MRSASSLLRFQDSPIQVDRTWSWLPEKAVRRHCKYGRRINRLSFKGTLTKVLATSVLNAQLLSLNYWFSFLDQLLKNPYQSSTVRFLQLWSLHTCCSRTHLCLYCIGACERLHQSLFSPHKQHPCAVVGLLSARGLETHLSFSDLSLPLLSC